MRRPSRIAFAGLAFLLAVALVHAAPAAEERLTVPASAPEAVVFNWDTDRCEEIDIPDAPPRAFRDSAGTIHLIATHQDNRAFTGPDFAHLTHPCAVIYRGDHQDDPAKFDDRQWLTAFATDDGKKIFALVHNEFQGNLRPTLCPSRKYMSCWYNAITFAISVDGGASFHQPPAPANVIAAPSVRYAPDAGHPIGYFQPTNIVRKDGAYYFMFLATTADAQKGGVCLARTTDVADPGSWRAWDGSGFNARLDGPYFDRMAQTCRPVGGGSLFEMGSLAYDRTSGLFICLSAISVGKGDAAHPQGAYYATSPDLIAWSAPVQLFRSPAPADAPGENVRYGLFSLIDEASTTYDFRDITSYDHLYLYYVKFDLTRQPYARVLAKKEVSVTPR